MRSKMAALEDSCPSWASFCDLQDLDLQPKVRGLVALTPSALGTGRRVQQRAGHLWLGPGWTDHRRGEMQGVLR